MCRLTQVGKKEKSFSRLIVMKGGKHVRSVIGTLYITFPDALCERVYQELGGLYPHETFYSHQADELCIYMLKVPYPTGSKRYGLAGLYQKTARQVTWTWQAPEGVAVFPGGSLHFYAPSCFGTDVFSRLREVFPTEQFYMFVDNDSAPGGGFAYLVDIPAPAAGLEQTLNTLIEVFPGSAWSWWPLSTEEVSA